MKLRLLFIALIIYGSLWLIGYYLVLEHDPKGFGAFFFALVHMALQLLLTIITIVLVVPSRRHHFSVVSWLALLFNTAFLVFLACAPGSFESKTALVIASSCGILVFLIQIGVMFFGKKEVKTQ